VLGGAEKLSGDKKSKTNEYTSGVNSVHREEKKGLKGEGRRARRREMKKGRKEPTERQKFKAERWRGNRFLTGRHRKPRRKITEH